MREIRQSEVECEEGDEKRKVNPWTRVRPRKKQFEEREKRIQRVLADITPCIIPPRIPWASIQHRPEHNRHEERKRRDGGIVERMQLLQRSWPGID